MGERRRGQQGHVSDPWSAWQSFRARLVTPGRQSQAAVAHQGKGTTVRFAGPGGRRATQGEQTATRRSDLRDLPECHDPLVSQKWGAVLTGMLRTSLDTGGEHLAK